jgi:hypothetical protein
VKPILRVAQDILFEHRAWKRPIRGGPTEVVCRSDEHARRPEFPCVTYRLAQEVLRLNEDKTEIRSLSDSLAPVTGPWSVDR